MFYSEALNGILLYSLRDELYAPWRQTDSKSTSGFWGDKSISCLEMEGTLLVVIFENSEFSYWSI